MISLRVIVTGILHEAMKGTSPTRGSHSPGKVAVMEINITWNLIFLWESCLISMELNGYSGFTPFRQLGTHCQKIVKSFLQIRGGQGQSTIGGIVVWRL